MNLSKPTIIPEVKKRLAWLRATVEEAKGQKTVKETLRESKNPKRYQGHATYMTKLIEVEPTTF